MSGATNRRFVRSARALLAFQLVLAGGATGLAIWAATRVQALVDQRDVLQARVEQLEARQTRWQVAPVEPVPETQPVPLAATEAAGPQAAAAAPSRPGPARSAPEAMGVRVHRGTPAPARVETPQPSPVPSTPPPRSYEPPYVPPREPPPAYVPPRRPPATARPAPQQPAPGAAARPIRPIHDAPAAAQAAPAAVVPRPTTMIIRPTATRPQAGAPATVRPQSGQAAPPRRIRPRPADTAQNPPK